MCIKVCFIAIFFPFCSLSSTTHSSSNYNMSDCRIKYWVCIIILIYLCRIVSKRVWQ
ncbi:hypothetical protein BVRB_8g192170 [Beta vulgaris subsp. vulgaris]|nr:hypothetical protein BVRB_8g192170 [Beta vulgaris subsp. vulgaris]